MGNLIFFSLQEEAKVREFEHLKVITLNLNVLRLYSFLQHIYDTINYWWEKCVRIQRTRGNETVQKYFMNLCGRGYKPRVERDLDFLQLLGLILYPCPLLYSISSLLIVPMLTKMLYRQQCEKYDCHTKSVSHQCLAILNSDALALT